MSAERVLLMECRELINSTWPPDVPLSVRYPQTLVHRIDALLATPQPGREAMSDKPTGLPEEPTDILIDWNHGDPIYESWRSQTHHTVINYMDALRSRCEELSRDRDLLARDAERYRWLRENIGDLIYNGAWRDGKPLIPLGVPLDRQIDAALSKEKT